MYKKDNNCKLSERFQISQQSLSCSDTISTRSGITDLMLRETGMHETRRWASTSHCSSSTEDLLNEPIFTPCLEDSVNELLLKSEHLRNSFQSILDRSEHRMVTRHRKEEKNNLVLDNERTFSQHTFDTSTVVDSVNELFSSQPQPNSIHELFASRPPPKFESSRQQFHSTTWIKDRVKEQSDLTSMGEHTCAPSFDKEEIETSELQNTYSEMRYYDAENKTNSFSSLGYVTMNESLEEQPVSQLLQTIPTNPSIDSNQKKIMSKRQVVDLEQMEVLKRMLFNLQHVSSELDKEIKDEDQMKMIEHHPNRAEFADNQTDSQSFSKLSAHLEKLKGILEESKTFHEEICGAKR